MILAAAIPQRGQCLLPVNIMPKHDGHATVASRDSQNWHRVESDETAAPQLKQFKVSACMHAILTVAIKLDYVAVAMRCWQLP